MIEYVAGLCFDAQKKRVVLIKKLHGPSQLIGTWNGVGGKVEQGESPHQAMSREFHEETGVVIWENEWTEFLRLTHSSDWLVHFFYTACTTHAENVRSMTDEQVSLGCVDRICTPDDVSSVTPNLRWIVPMAMGHRKDHVEVYTVDEEKVVK